MSLGNFGRIAISWTVITAAGLYAFVLSKNSVDKRRYEDMKIRQRMRDSNQGKYEPTSERKFSV